MDQQVNENAHHCRMRQWNNMEPINKVKLNKTSVFHKWSQKTLVELILPEDTQWTAPAVPTRLESQSSQSLFLNPLEPWAARSVFENLKTYPESHRGIKSDVVRPLQTWHPVKAVMCCGIWDIGLLAVEWQQRQQKRWRLLITFLQNNTPLWWIVPL